MENSNSPMKSFGAKVKTARLSKGWTQRELADKVGVTHEWICKIEKGNANVVSLNLMTKFGKELGFRMDIVIVDDIKDKVDNPINVDGIIDK